MAYSQHRDVAYLKSCLSVLRSNCHWNTKQILCMNFTIDITVKTKKEEFTVLHLLAHQREGLRGITNLDKILMNVS